MQLCIALSQIDYSSTTTPRQRKSGGRTSRRQ